MKPLLEKFKSTIRMIAFTCIIGLSFTIGMVYDELSSFWRKPVTIQIANQSNQPLKSIAVTYSGFRTAGSIRVEPETSQKLTTIRYYQAGEGSFSLLAELENGTVLSSGEGYIEAGYTLNMIVTDTKIIENNFRYF